MGRWIITLNDLSTQWSAAMWRVCWQGTVVLLLVFVVCRAFPKIPARFQCWLWRLSYLKLLLAFLLAGAIPLAVLPESTLLPAPLIHSVGFQSEHKASTNATLPNSSSIRNDAETVRSTQPVSSVVQQSLPSSSTHLPHITSVGYLMLLWLVGVMWGGYRLIRAWKYVQYLRKSAKTITDIHAHQALADICRAFHLKDIPALMIGEVDTPVFIGITRSCILLPPLFLNFDNASLRLLLAHEVAHQKRRDLSWGWLEVVTEILFFYHPLVWLLRREARVAQEMACDAMALQMLATPATEYGKMLLNLMQRKQSRKADVFSMGISEYGRQLKRRIVALRWATVSKPLLFISIGILALFLLCLFPWKIVTCGVKAKAAAFADTQVSLTFALRTEKDTVFYFYSSPTPVISPDGQRVYFITDKYWAQDNKSFPENEILRYQRASGELTDTGLPMANIAARFDRFGYQNHIATFSADGRYVVYASKEAQSVEVDEYGHGRLTRIFRKDLETGKVADLTQTVDGAPPNGASKQPAISGDGTVVAFLSYATNLTNFHFDTTTQTLANPATQGFYLRDLKNGQTEFVPIPGVSRISHGIADPVSGLHLSSDGNVVVFSGAVAIIRKNRHSIDTTSWQEPMAYDRKTKKLLHIGMKSGEHRYGIEPHVSADGRFVVFRMQRDESACYLYDMQRHVVEKVGDRLMIGNPAISADGRYIIFASRTPSPEEADDKGKGLWERKAPSEIYLFDRETKRTECLSNENTIIYHKLGLEYYDNLTPSISADGRYICFAAHLADRSFQYMSSNPYTNSLLHSAWAILVYDRASGKTTTPIVSTSWKTTPAVVTPVPEPVNKYGDK